MFTPNYQPSYSIWLMPEPDSTTQAQLKNIIFSLSSSYGGPVFEPHVTMISSFLGNEKELLEKTEIISKKIKPFKIIFGTIGYDNIFFQSLFLKVDINIELIKSRKIASKEFKLDENCNKYMPHLSLAYGNYKLKVKKKMISKLRDIPVGFSVNRIFLAHNDEINLIWRVINSFKLINNV